MTHNIKIGAMYRTKMVILLWEEPVERDTPYKEVGCIPNNSNCQLVEIRTLPSGGRWVRLFNGALLGWTGWLQNFESGFDMYLEEVKNPNNDNK